MSKTGSSDGKFIAIPNLRLKESDIADLMKKVRKHPYILRWALINQDVERKERKWFSGFPYRTWTESTDRVPYFTYEDVIAYAEVGDLVCPTCGRDF